MGRGPHSPNSSAHQPDYGFHSQNGYGPDDMSRSMRDDERAAHGWRNEGDYQMSPNHQPHWQDSMRPNGDSPRHMAAGQNGQWMDGADQWDHQPPRQEGRR